MVRVAVEGGQGTLQAVREAVVNDTHAVIVKVSQLLSFVMLYTGP